jgi:hypothetical protein
MRGWFLKYQVGAGVGDYVWVCGCGCVDGVKHQVSVGVWVA